MNSCRKWLALSSCCGLLLCPPLAVAAPLLYGSPYNESPTRGEPDDLLLLSGYPLAAADTVVYQAVADTTQVLQAPAAVPAQSTSSSGVADLVSVADAPYSLTVRLPAALATNQSYVLWVQDSGGNWSNGVMINDARPLWFTPDTVYQTAATANLPRVLKVVGRNLQPAAGAVTQVKLVGPATYTLAAANVNSDPGTTVALQRYVADVQLPASMAVGTYSVLLSRDGTGWVPLTGPNSAQPAMLTVKADPSVLPQFSVGDPGYGGCQPRTSGQPDQDATPCILKAISAAYAAGGGSVVFGAGTWPLLDVNNASNLPGDGIVVPPGVSLLGAGASSTTIERGSGFPASDETFALQGNNTVQGINFHDATVYTPQSSGPPMLKIGVQWYFKNNYLAQGVQARQVSNVVITQNSFDQPFFAISNGSLPSDHIFITSNVFGGAYLTAIYLSTDQNYANDPDSLQYPYQFSDAVIAYNSFYPSSYVSSDHVQGVIASQISSGLRVDFSSNTADGTSTQYLYDPVNDPKGWRAAFFWSTGNNQEMTLVSRNTATCPGDKAGDGEGIVYDSGNEWGGFAAPQPAGAPPPGAGARPVLAASSSGGASSITLQGSLVSTFPTSNGNGPTSIPASYYQGFWLQVVQGPGLGQWRKITAVGTGTDGSGNATATFTVSPAFDVLPQANSLAIIARAYWQNITVANFIDQRQPTCTKANAEKPSGGAISWYSSTADSAMEGNQQYDTSGILLNHLYQLPGLDAQPDAQFFRSVIQSSNEVRNNLIDGEYQWTSSSSSSGIQLFYGATHDTAPPPVLGYGVSVAGNSITQADTASQQPGVNQSYGALGLGPSWWTGPLDSSKLSAWKMADATLLFHNTLSNIAYSAADGLDRLGIGLDRGTGTSASAPVVWRSVFYGNTCNKVSTLFSDNGNGTVYFCPSNPTSSCECSGVQSIDVGVSASASASMVASGGSVSFQATVSNYASQSANAVSLAVEMPPGIVATALGTTLGSCDLDTMTCALGAMTGGSNVTVTLTANTIAAGTWPTMFSVTHQDADAVVLNNGAEVDTVVTPATTSLQRQAPPASFEKIPATRATY